MSLVFESLGELSTYLDTRPPVEVVDPGVPLETLVHGTADLWLQPSVRKVVGFIARNVASIPLHVYERVSDEDRVRVRDHPLSRVVSSPAPRTTSYRFWELVFIDWLLHDRWCVQKAVQQDGSIQLVRLPVRKWRLQRDGIDRVTAVLLYRDGRWVEHDPDGFMYDHGYAHAGVNGTSPAQTLKQLLDESAEAVAYRRAVWKRGGRVPAVIERPIGAPPWGAEAKGRFRRSWQNFTRGGGQEGGTPILEDGMKLVETKAFSPQDAQDLEGRKLTDVEVATAYYIAPELLGIREGTYSNVESFRQSLYRDALGPYITGWEQTVNVMLTPDLSAGRDLYVEAHVEAKLRGSFDEQARILSTATGRPWMTTNEARGRMNLPAVGGDADELVTPLNVTVGGLASPRDTGDQNRGAASRTVKTKAAERDLGTVTAETGALRRDLTNYQTLLAEWLSEGLGLKSPADLPQTFDVETWNTTLARILGSRTRRISQAAAFELLATWNPDHDGWDPDVMDGWLSKAAGTNADRINRALYDRIAVALVSGEGWQKAVSDILGEEGFGDTWGETLSTEAASFGRQDAAVASGLATKTWTTTSKDPRPSHSAISGETVPIHMPFSNGARWPGDWSAGVAEVVNCRCVVTYSQETES